MDYLNLSSLLIPPYLILSLVHFSVRQVNNISWIWVDETMVFNTLQLDKSNIYCKLRVLVKKLFSPTKRKTWTQVYGASLDNCCRLC